jgi:hypothetical protein
MKLPMWVAAAALMMAGAAAAQPGAGGGQGGGNPAMAKVRESCAADMQKLCPDKHGAERHQCMKDNADKVSDGCKTAMADMMKARQAAQPQ